MSNKNGVYYGTPLTPGPLERARCAGTEPPWDSPCMAPAAAKIDGLLLCKWHAGEFEAQARTDVLEVAALYLSRWLETAREICNDELVRRLEATRKEVEVDMKRVPTLITPTEGNEDGKGIRPACGASASRAGPGRVLGLAGDRLVR